MNRPDKAEEYDVTNFKPRGTYSKKEIEQMEQSKLKCLKMLQENKENKKNVAD